MTDKQTIKCGVAGVGYLGQHHARVYHELPGCEFTGIYEPDDKKAKKITKKYKCERFATIEDLSQACDGVSVVVPTDKHHEVAIPLLRAGCHLLVEKPISVTLQEAEDMLAIAKDKNLVLQVGHIEHFNPVASYLQEHVNAPRYISSERLAPFNVRGSEVGVVLDLMIHDIGIILQLVRSPVCKIDSVGVCVVSQSEDIANARIEFENGCVANLNASRVSLKKLRKFRLFQPRTYLSMDFMEQKGYLMRLVGDKPDITNIKREKIPIEREEPLKLELSAFINCIAIGAEPKVSGMLGRTALEIAITISEQIRAQDHHAIDVAGTSHV